MLTAPLAASTSLARVLALVVLLLGLAPIASARSTSGDQPTESELAGALWVEGRIVLPPNTPTDEIVRVVARGRTFAGRAFHSVAVGTDGAFRVAFHPKTQRGTIELDAHYLYLDAPAQVVLAEREPLVLKPRLGARIVGRCTLAESMRDRREKLAGTRVHLDAFPDFGVLDGFEGLLTAIERRAALETDLTFELGGISPSFQSMVRVEPDAACAVERQVPPLEPGTTHTIEFELTAGVTARGRVVDESGVGVANVDVSLTSAEGPDPASARMPSARLPSARTRKDGSFVLHGVPSGAWGLVTRVRGFRPTTAMIPAAADGGEVELDVRITPAPRLQGRVVDPSGAPIARATIELEGLDNAAFDFLDVEMMLSRPQPVRSAKDGTFTATDLRDVNYRVVARATLGPGEIWESAPVEVHPGVEPLEIVLREPVLVTGRVTDDAGAPISNFIVRAFRDDHNFEERAFDDVDGRFEMRLPAGSWHIAAVARGAGISPAALLVLEKAATPIELRIARHAVVGGLVVDPEGRPARNTEVEWLTNTDESTSAIARTMAIGFADIVDEPSGSTYTDADGFFHLVGVPAGSICFVASSTEWCASQHVKLDIAPGTDVPNVKLALRHGGNVEFEVLDLSGNPAAGWRVFFEPYEDHVLSFPMGDDGRARTRKLAPGSYMVTAREEGWFAHEAPETGWSQRIEVVADQTTVVVFGGATPPPVTVRGVVLAGGEPVDGAEVEAARYEDNPSFASRTRTTGADGRFGMPLDRGGLYAWTVKTPDAETLRFVRISDEGEIELNFDIGSGGIDGVLNGPDGKPFANAEVSVKPDRDAEDRTQSWTTRTVTTNAGGRFEFPRLPQGTYRVEYEAQFGSYAPAFLEAVEVRDDARVEIVLRAERRCTLRGIVRDESGQPARNVGIFARDERGWSAQDDALARTDANGRFEFTKLPPGSTTVYARDAGRASLETDVIVLAANAPNEIELALVPATRVYVGVKDSDGRWIERAQVRIRDELGRDRNAASKKGCPDDEENGTLEAVLPPGKFSIVVRDEHGRSATRSVTLTGKSVAYFELRFEG